LATATAKHPPLPPKFKSKQMLLQMLAKAITDRIREREAGSVGSNANHRLPQPLFHRLPQQMAGHQDGEALQFVMNAAATPLLLLRRCYLQS